MKEIEKDTIKDYKYKQTFVLYGDYRDFITLYNLNGTFGINDKISIYTKYKEHICSIILDISNNEIINFLKRFKEVYVLHFIKEV